MPDSLDVSKMNDHELLLVLHTKFDSKFDEVFKDIGELKDGTTSRIVALEHKTDQVEGFKASKKDLEVTNARVERMNTRINMFMGGLIVINALAIPLFFYYLSKH
jgi:hypothetical protein